MSLYKTWPQPETSELKTYYERMYACREKANWINGRYRVPISPDCSIVDHLGRVKLRADGRWNWWRWESKFHSFASGQGVAASEADAIAKVLEGWN